MHWKSDRNRSENNVLTGVCFEQKVTNDSPKSWKHPTKIMWKSVANVWKGLLKTLLAPRSIWDAKIVAKTSPTWREKTSKRHPKSMKGWLKALLAPRSIWDAKNVGKTSPTWREKISKRHPKSMTTAAKSDATNSCGNKLGRWCKVYHTDAEMTQSAKRALRRA